MKNKKSAFTLVELLVVIAIIGILVTVMLGFFSGSTESARATECMNNMRILSLAVNDYATQNEYGHFPPAGTLKYWEFPDNYPQRTGWIARKPSPGGEQVGGVITFSDEDNFGKETVSDGLKYALTAGAIWGHVGRRREVYTCPVHAAECYKKNKRKPGWSYVMNSDFYWASVEGGKAHRGWVGKGLGSWGAPDRVLLFAEIQAIDDEKFKLVANLNGKDKLGDSVLQHEDKHGAEVIGFNHKVKTGYWQGHVSFVDGHVQKLLVPQRGSINLKQLTQKLCQGHELSFNGREYQDLSEK